MTRRTRLIEYVNRDARPGTAGRAQYGTAGVTFNGPPRTHLALFELTSAMVYPDLETASQTHFNLEPTPYTTDARIVWCHQFDPDDRTAGGAAVRSYGGASASPGETLYHPAAFRNGDGYAVGLPTFRPGSRVLCLFNWQSGRWEIISPPLDLWRFEMVEALSFGGSAQAVVIGWDPVGLKYTDDLPDQGEVNLTVYDFQGRFSKMATQSGDAGALGWAKYLPDSDRWEIVTMETPGDFWGTLDAELTQATASVTVTMEAMLGGYDVFGQHWVNANGGAKILAHNPVGSDNFADHWWAGTVSGGSGPQTGDRVYCHWDMKNSKYWILLVEPNNKSYQNLEVVTAVQTDAQGHVTGTTTKTIQLPPWTTIS